MHCMDNGLLSRLCCTVYPKKYAHGFCFAVLCCGYTLTDFPISIRLTSLALRQSYDCPSASKATLMNMDKYFMWIHYERLHNHNKAKHNKTMCIFLGMYCTWHPRITRKSEESVQWRGCLPVLDTSQYFKGLLPSDTRHPRHWSEKLNVSFSQRPMIYSGLCNKLSWNSILQSQNIQIRLLTV